MLTIGVDEEYDEWDEEEAILIVQLVMFVQCFAQQL